jgi:hypothetical protein
VSSTDDPETATLAFDALARWAPWSPESPTVLADAVTDLTGRISWRAAANGLVTAAAGSPRGGQWSGDRGGGLTARRSGS